MAFSGLFTDGFLVGDQSLTEYSGRKHSLCFVANILFIIIPNSSLVALRALTTVFKFQQEYKIDLLWNFLVLNGYWFLLLSNTIRHGMIKVFLSYTRAVLAFTFSVSNYLCCLLLNFSSTGPVRACIINMNCQRIFRSSEEEPKSVALERYLHFPITSVICNC